MWTSWSVRTTASSCTSCSTVLGTAASASIGLTIVLSTCASSSTSIGLSISTCPGPSPSCFCSSLSSFIRYTAVCVSVGATMTAGAGVFVSACTFGPLL